MMPTGRRIACIDSTESGNRALYAIAGRPGIWEHTLGVGEVTVRIAGRRMNLVRDTAVEAELRNPLDGEVTR